MDAPAIFSPIEAYLSWMGFKRPPKKEVLGIQLKISL
jgi:hypothetical protein